MPTVQFTWHIGRDIIIIRPPLQYNILYKTHKSQEEWGERKTGSHSSLEYSQKPFFIISLFSPKTGRTFTFTRHKRMWPDIYICRELIHIFDDDSEKYSGPHSDSQVKDQWWCVMMGLGHFTLWCLSLFQLPKLSPLLHHYSRDSHTQGWLNDLQASIKWFLSQRKSVN